MLETKNDREMRVAVNKTMASPLTESSSEIRNAAEMEKLNDKNLGKNMVDLDGNVQTDTIWLGDSTFVRVLPSKGLLFRTLFTSDGTWKLSEIQAKALETGISKKIAKSR